MTKLSMPKASAQKASTKFAMRLDRMLTERAGAVLAVLETGPLSFGDCYQRMLWHSGRLERIGIHSGDRVLIRSRDDEAVITLVLTLMRIGVTPVIADAGATNAECSELARICDVRAAFADTIFPMPDGVDMVTLAPIDPIAQAPASSFPDMPAAETALLVLTSGTTSAPKAVELTYDNLIAQFDIFEDVYGFGPDMRLLNLLPLHHVDGLIRGPLSAVWFGGSVHRATAFSVQTVPEILASVARDGITHLISVPAMLRIIERAGADRPTAFATSSFRFVLSSADMLDAALWNRFQERFSVPVANAYGLSEVVCDALFAGPDAATLRVGTLGRAVGCSARLVDDMGTEVAPGETGELVLSGPTVMRGYFNAPELTKTVLRDGAFHTGDYMRINDAGLFEFVGRKKTAIVSAGNTINPESATQALASMPGVLEAVAFGVPDVTMGERLVAAVVPAPGSTLTEADLAAHCRSLLSPERAPREYRLMEALPRGGSGKVRLEELRAQSEEVLPAIAEQQPDLLAIAAKCFNVPVESLSLDSSPYNTRGWDSLAHLQLIESVESAYKIRFSPMQIVVILCLGDLKNCLEEALSEA